MAKSVTENSAISFRIAMDSYKNIRGFTNKQLAEDLGCSEQTISNLHNNPLAGSGRYILPLLEKLKMAERSRYL